ncbi:myo-inositol-1(or 4)-monophosphatase [Mariprofundus micogutta]|uniref:Myo-inositol-1(Or 4)-monophosphatase n=1 Tax=Mariprofundus micogutta TaxID=1921010 RepID=A0A1L8CJQ2_9PROT|nr:inositol monophosphatase family protein [Mariprofundus micogutta]GAV19154.1 myo-inositol-1(or 4)-monophosphatase [Mariprofundus micogutta]
MSYSNTITVAELSAILKQAGREIIMPAYRSSVIISGKADGSIVTETDLACQTYIQDKLAQLDSSIAFLGEEMSEEEQLHCLRTSNGSYWCLDPLDGTTNFATNLPGFALSLALIENGLVELACIYDPVRDELFTAKRGSGAELNGTDIHASAETELNNAVGYVDFKRLQRDTAVKLACDKLYRSQRNLGSCALEWAWLAAGRGQFIIHGGEKVWDFSAGSLIATEAGCISGDFNGQPLFPDAGLSSPILAACSSPVHESLKRQLSE